MLCHLYATCCSHQGRGCGNIKAVCIIPSRANDLKDLHSGIHPGSIIPHGCCTSGDLISCLSPCTFCGEGCQKSGILCRCRLSAHNLIHYGIRFIISKIFFIYYFYNCLFNHHSISFIKFLNIVFPSGVIIDSGWNCTPKTGYSLC